MNNKQEIIDRIMRLEKELSDAEAELQDSNELSCISDDDIMPGMVFCPKPNGTQRSVVIIQINDTVQDKFKLGGKNGIPCYTWDDTFTREQLKMFLINKNYEKAGILPFNFDLMKHSSETPF